MLKTKKFITNVFAKKALSAFVAATTAAASLVVPVFATETAADTTKIYTDFSSKTSGGYDTGNYYGTNATNSPGIKYEEAKGVLGKSTNDSVLHFHNTTDAITITNGNYLQFTNLDTTASANITAGTTHLSFQLAFDNFDSAKNIYMTYSNSDKYAKLIGIDTEGKLTLAKRSGTTSYTKQMEKNRWYKFDVVIDTTTNSKNVIINYVTVYIDGEMVGNKYEYGYNNFTHVTLLRFESALVENGTAEDGTTKKYKPTGLYIDNFSYAFYSTATTINVANPTLYTDDYAYLSSGAYYVSDFSEFNPTSLLEKINSNLTGYKATAVDLTNGEVDLSAMTNLSDLDGKYLRINSTSTAVTKADDVYELFVPIKKEGQTVYQPMITEPVAANNAFFRQLDTNYLANNGKDVSNYTYGQLENIGGKSGKSYGVTLANAKKKAEGSSENPTLTESNFYLTLAKAETTPNTAKPFTIELSLFQKGDVTESYFRIAGVSENASIKTFPVYISKFGEITTSYPNKQVLAAKANLNEWNKFALTIYPATAKMDIYLNGEKIAENCDILEDVTKNYSSISEITVGTNYNIPAATSETSANAVVAIDDITMYSGVADEAKSSVLNGADGNVVSISADETALSALNLSATENGSIKVYTDNTFATEVAADGTVTRDSVVVVTSSDGEILKYYYPDYTEVIINQPTLTYANGKFTAALTTRAPKSNSDKALLLLAVYENGVLVGNNSLGTGLSNGDISVEFSGKSGQTAKAFVWDVNTFKPLTSPASKTATSSTIIPGETPFVPNV